MVPKIFLALLALLLASCVTSSPQSDYGVRKGFEAYIPARISVLSCIPLPLSARYAGLKPINISEEDQKKLCGEFDKKVIEGFTGQPFMKGYTPALVAQLLKKNSATGILKDVPLLWSFDQSSCPGCNSGPRAYENQTEKSAKWLNWLNQFSKATRYSDAILIPFLVDAWEAHNDDRGVLLSERYVKADLFLIDTNHGKLLWSGTRSATVNNQSLRESPASEYPPYPHWDRLTDRLFTEALWLSFPGRQMND